MELFIFERILPAFPTGLQIITSVASVSHIHMLATLLLLIMAHNNTRWWGCVQWKNVRMMP